MFGSCEGNNLEHIINDKELLDKNLHFINVARYTTFAFKKDYTINKETPKNHLPKEFQGFAKFYPDIYSRWIFMIRICFDTSHKLYKFFGGKGITVSKDFLNSKTFCKWCLKKGLISKLGSYDKYLIRKERDKGFSFENCNVISEKDIHIGKTLKLALEKLFLIKKYEEGHPDNLTFMNFYAKYYVYGLAVEDALAQCERGGRGDVFIFSANNFYNAVADETCCTLSVFKSRIHWSYMNKIPLYRPYDMLRPDYSLSEACALHGITSYHAKWDQSKWDMSKGSMGKRRHQKKINID